ncbi:hypothetical protein EG328_009017 [Venturia inaequalis]|uniref:3'-5' exonuclease domain-containing protein n=1 Tax=Venturia inaequalis TaxID=5025 RepID=A0A8H3US96_VENIN|nr:hypothetical protein EG328_009017 [Venturia inaequalis]KAE9975766.1 hypothetical protein EG327_008341 [Venturia inaequalis]
MDDKVEKDYGIESRERFTHISYTARNGNPITVTYCTSVEQLQMALKPFLEEDFVGFDCEWKPYDREKTEPKVTRTWKADDYIRPMSRTKEALSTAQFASHDHIVIAHFATFKTDNDNPSQLVPSNLRTLLSSNDILKLGSGIQQDANICHKYLEIECHGLVDLKDIHFLVTNTTKEEKRANGEPGLGEMMRIYLDKWMSGKGEVQISNWSLPQPLLAEQLEYAGNDAFAAVVLHEVMLSRLDTHWREMLTPSSSSPTKKRKAKGEPCVQNPPAASPEEKKTRARAAKNRKHTAEFSKLTPELGYLYESLKVRSKELMREYDLGPWYVGDLNSILKIVNCTPLPVAVGGFEALTVKKGTKGEFVYEFVNVVRGFVGLEGLVEPEGWREEFQEKRMIKENEKEVM